MRRLLKSKVSMIGKDSINHAIGYGELLSFYSYKQRNHGILIYQSVLLSDFPMLLFLLCSRTADPNNRGPKVKETFNEFDKAISRRLSFINITLIYAD
jgi:hypothetical protein